jgi:hypothetical protein
LRATLIVLESNCEHALSYVVHWGKVPYNVT